MAPIALFFFAFLGHGALAQGPALSIESAAALADRLADELEAVQAMEKSLRDRSSLAVAIDRSPYRSAQGPVSRDDLDLALDRLRTTAAGGQSLATAVGERRQADKKLRDEEINRRHGKGGWKFWPLMGWMAGGIMIAPAFQSGGDDTGIAIFMGIWYLGGLFPMGYMMYERPSAEDAVLLKISRKELQQARHATNAFWARLRERSVRFPLLPSRRMAWLQAQGRAMVRVRCEVDLSDVAVAGELPVVVVNGDSRESTADVPESMALEPARRMTPP